MEEHTIFERLLNGEVIAADDPDSAQMMVASFETKKLLVQLNNATEPDKVRELLGQIIGSEIDSSTNIFTPFNINYGKNTKIGKNVFINFNCTLLDLGGITIEDDVLIAPNVSILSEGHPIDPAKRHSLKPKSVHIKKNVWICTGATVLPGVTIGENSIIAAGAVVSYDVPDNTIVGGIPAKVLRQIY